MGVHVWQESPNPTKPYATKLTAALTIKEGLKQAEENGGGTVTVWGDCSGGHCLYQENVKIPIGGLDIVGESFPIIDGGQMGRVVTFKPMQKQVTYVRGFEIRNGTTDDEGAGLYAEDSAVIIAGNCIHDNTSKKNTGGGICIKYTDEKYYVPSYVISNGIFRNRAVNGGGVGVIGVTIPWKGARSDPLVFIHANKIGPDNQAAYTGSAGTNFDGWAHGGGVSVYRAPADIAGNDIFKNHVLDTEHMGQGGGIAIYNIDQSSRGERLWGGVRMEFWSDRSSLGAGQATIRNNWIHENGAEKGGGVTGLWLALVDYRENIISDNSGGTSAGGIYATTGAWHTFVRNVIKNNACEGSPPDGRGGAMHASCAAVLDFRRDNIVKGNTATNFGGGLSLDNADLRTLDGSLYVIENKVMRGMGGGIYSRSKISGDDLIEKAIWAPCDHENLFNLNGTLVEGNQASTHGAAVAVEKQMLVLPTYAQDIGISKCVIKNNSALKGRKVSEAVYLNRGSFGTSYADFKIRDTLIEGHSEMAGVQLIDPDGNSDFSYSIFAKNGTGVRFDGKTMNVHDNLFDQNTTAQVEILGHTVKGKGVGGSTEDIDMPSYTKPDLQKNEFKGAGVSADGILFSGKSSFGGSIKENDITGHRNDGINASAGVFVSAPQNWWGSPAGPTVPKGPKNGDAITSTVKATPFATKAWGRAAPATLNLKVPQEPRFIPPVAPDCLDQGRKPPQQGKTTTQTMIPSGGAPPIKDDTGHTMTQPTPEEGKTQSLPPKGTGTTPQQPSQQPQIPAGSSVKQTSEFRYNLTLPDGTTHAAIILPGALAAILDSEGVPQGLVGPTSEWLPPPQSEGVAQVSVEPTETPTERTGAGQIPRPTKTAVRAPYKRQTHYGALALALLLAGAATVPYLPQSVLTPAIGYLGGSGSLPYSFNGGNAPVTSVQFVFPPDFAQGITPTGVTPGWTYEFSAQTATLTVSGGTLQPGQTLTFQFIYTKYHAPGLFEGTAVGTTSQGTQIPTTLPIIVQDLFVLRALDILSTYSLLVFLLAGLVAAYWLYSNLRSSGPGGESEESQGSDSETQS